MRDADRRPLHFISQIQDITALKQVEQIKQIKQILRNNEERFGALAELSSDWFWSQMKTSVSCWFQKVRSM